MCCWREKLWFKNWISTGMKFILHAFNPIRLSMETETSSEIVHSLGFIHTVTHIIHKLRHRKNAWNIRNYCKTSMCGWRKRGTRLLEVRFKTFSMEIKYYSIANTAHFSKEFRRLLGFFFTQCTLHCFVLLCLIVFRFVSVQQSIKCSFSNIRLLSTSPLISLLDKRKKKVFPLVFPFRNTKWHNSKRKKYLITKVEFSLGIFFLYLRSLRFSSLSLCLYPIISNVMRNSPLAFYFTFPKLN